MRSLVKFAAAIGLASPLAFAQTLDLKTGGWDMEMQLQASGSGVPPQLEKLSSEQRARFEAAMSRKRTHKYKTCLSTADLQQLARGPDEDEGCSYTNVKRSARHWEADLHCPRGGRSGHMVLDALSPDHVTGHMVQRSATDGGQREIKADMEGRWVKGDCKGHDD